MSYTFRVVFSGPCAYVPNVVEGDETPATSWSVVLPDIRRGWDGDADGISADRHLPVVQFSEEKFYASEAPDVRVGVRYEDGSYKTSGIYILNGHRVTFDLPGASALKVDQQAIDPKIMSSQDAVRDLLDRSDPKIKSMTWLPAMRWLRSALQWFGVQGVNLFFEDDGFPVPRSIAGHVILQQGSLVANEIDTVIRGGQVLPTIWEFRPYSDENESPNNPRQALARSIALEAVGLKDPVTITVATSETIKTLTLKAAQCNGVVEIAIKNRELEDIFLRAAEFGGESVDLDFRYMYTKAKNYDPSATDYLLPHLFQGSGTAGNETATCGGHTFTGYSSALGNVVKMWPSAERR